MFKKLSSWFNLSLLKNATPRAGMIATDLVRSTLYQTGRVKSKKPSMTNCPAYVPVIVELYPAANNPTAQIYLAFVPRNSSKIVAAYSRSIKLLS